jgi:hypothetical protein
MEIQLIQLYIYVCECYSRHLSLHFTRFSNNYLPVFTDQELMTVYIFGAMQGHQKKKEIYKYMNNHWKTWFPKMPSYQAFNDRLNKIHWHFSLIINELINTLYAQSDFASLLTIAQKDTILTDSLPIILSKRPYTARVATQIADKGYCSTKKLYYHGLKLHTLNFSMKQALPMPYRFEFTAASHNDLTVLKTHLQNEPIAHACLVGDKIYRSEEFITDLQNFDSKVINPIKLHKNQDKLSFYQQIYSTLVSKVRQPIESFFNWINEKTGIQTASKVRAEMGLYQHCYGKLAVALCFLVFNP